MRITGCDCWSVEMPLAKRFTIAYRSVDAARNVFIALATDDGQTGYGCAAPDKMVTGEDPAEAERLMASALPSLAKGQDVDRAGAILESARRELASFPSLRCALDTALLDLVGKVAGRPAWRLCGAVREAVATSMTISILPERETVAKAKEWVGQGFRVLKIKGGKGWQEDAARVLKVREAVGPAVALRFDANQGYGEEDALAFIAATEPAGLELIEQPTPARDLRALEAVTRRSRTPIMADESLLSLEGALELARTRACHLFNIKLMKVGGTRAAAEILAVGRAAGMATMIGCRTESALGIAAGLHVALTSPAVSWADLDGHIGLRGDPFAGAVSLRDGLLYPSDRPGLGIERPATST